jgi:hypothetical protein
MRECYRRRHAKLRNISAGRREEENHSLFALHGEFPKVFHGNKSIMLLPTQRLPYQMENEMEIERNSFLKRKRYRKNDFQKSFQNYSRLLSSLKKDSENFNNIRVGRPSCFHPRISPFSLHPADIKTFHLNLSKKIVLTPH